MTVGGRFYTEAKSDMTVMDLTRQEALLPLLCLDPFPTASILCIVFEEINAEDSISLHNALESEGNGSFSQASPVE